MRVSLRKVFETSHFPMCLSHHDGGQEIDEKEPREFAGWESIVWGDESKQQLGRLPQVSIYFPYLMRAQSCPHTASCGEADPTLFLFEADPSVFLF